MDATTRTIPCAHVIGPTGPLADAQTIAIDGGLIASIEPAPRPKTDRLLALPALVNTHDHGRAIRTSSIGADAKPLESWLHYLALFPPMACASWSRSRDAPIPPSTAARWSFHSRKDR